MVFFVSECMADRLKILVLLSLQAFLHILFLNKNMLIGI